MRALGACHKLYHGNHAQARGGCDGTESTLAARALDDRLQVPARRHKIAASDRMKASTLARKPSSPSVPGSVQGSNCDEPLTIVCLVTLCFRRLIHRLKEAPSTLYVQRSVHDGLWKAPIQTNVGKFDSTSFNPYPNTSAKRPGSHLGCLEQSGDCPFPTPATLSAGLSRAP